MNPVSPFVSFIFIIWITVPGVNLVDHIEQNIFRAELEAISELREVFDDGAGGQVIERVS